jgi:hypothetical protein
VKNAKAFVAAIVLCAAGSVFADYTVIDKGTWPQSWPQELEPLRKQAKTLEGPLAANQHYAIPFTKREEFESAWPHLLKVKSKGAPVVLVRGPNFFLGENVKAGVVVHAPPPGQTERGGLNATYIELIVDGEIIDLNRIPLPPDTPINDNRFKAEKQK